MPPKYVSIRGNILIEELHHILEYPLCLSMPGSAELNLKRAFLQREQNETETSEQQLTCH